MNEVLNSCGLYEFNYNKFNVKEFKFNVKDGLQMVGKF